MSIRIHGQQSKNTTLNESRITGAHRYWRLLITESTGFGTSSNFYTQIGFLGLYDVADLNNVATDYDGDTGQGETDIYTASSDQSGRRVGNAFDPGVLPWITAESGVTRRVNAPSPVNRITFQDPAWIKVEFVQAMDIRRVTVMNNGHYEGVGTFPKRYALQYSDDDVNWTTRLSEHITDWPTVESPNQFDPSDDYYRTSNVVEGGANGSPILPALSINAAGFIANENDLQFGGALTLPALSVIGTGDNVPTSLPSLTMTGEGIPGNASANFLPIELPAFTSTGVLVNGSLAQGSGTLPSLSGSLEGYQTGDLVGLVLPSLQAEGVGAIGGVGDVIATLPSIEIAGQILGPNDVFGASLPSLTAISMGASGFVGELNVRLPALMATGTTTDTLGVPLPSLTIEATGAGGQAATVFATLPTMSADIAGFDDSQLAGAILPSFTATGNAIGGRFGPVIASLPSLTATGSIADTTGIPLPILTINATGASGQAATVFATLPTLSADGAGFDEGQLVGAVLPAFEASAQGVGGQFGPIFARLPSLSSTGTVSDTTGIPLPALEVLAEGANGQAATIRAQLPRLSIESAGTDDSQFEGGVLPTLSADAAGVAGTFGPIFARLPSLNAEITALNGIDDASLPALKADGTGSIALPASLFGYLGALSAHGDGEFVDADEAGTAAIEAEMPTLNATGFMVSGNTYEGDSSLPGLALAASGITGTLGIVTASLPALVGTGELVSAVNADIALTLPALRLYATRVPDEAAVVTGTAVVMNVKHKALTEFQSYGFNSYATFAGMNLACSENGMFALVGDNDNGAIIEASLQMGKLDFDLPMLKTVDQLYTGYEADGNLLITAVADDGDEYQYTLVPQKLGCRHTSRTKLGRGMKGRYFQIGVQNVDGAHFRIDTLEPEPRPLKRRVR